MRMKLSGKCLSHGSDCRSREENHSGEANMGNGGNNIDQRKRGRAWLEKLPASNEESVAYRTGRLLSQAMHGPNLDVTEHATKKSSCGQQANAVQQQSRERNVEV